MSWEYDFLRTAAEVFELLVLGILPAVIIIILVVYMNKIVRAYFETRRAKAQIKKRQKARAEDRK